jgi:diadenosine tetraphosphate (Ap4A) HIT family hydrolase
MSHPGFTLHPRLANGTHPLGHEAGCRILLKDNALFPWVLVVPEVAPGTEDLHQLDEPTYRAVTSLVRRVSQWMTAHFRGEKLNVACIGNQVRQMHVHIVSRRPDDPAWPGTVWAHDGKQPYPPAQVAAIKASFEATFGAG